LVSRSGCQNSSRGLAVDPEAGVAVIVRVVVLCVERPPHLFRAPAVCRVRWGLYMGRMRVLGCGVAISSWPLIFSREVIVDSRLGCSRGWEVLSKGLNSGLMDVLESCERIQVGSAVRGMLGEGLRSQVAVRFVPDSVVSSDGFGER